MTNWKLAELTQKRRSWMKTNINENNKVIINIIRLIYII